MKHEQYIYTPMYKITTFVHCKLLRGVIIENKFIHTTYYSATIIGQC